MRLTETIRESVINAVLQDTPDIGREIKEAAAKALLGHAVASLPPKLRAVWDDPDLRGYLSTANYYNHCFIGVSVPQGCKLTKEQLDAYHEAAAKYDDLKRERYAMKNKLYGALKGFTTTKAAIAAMPELEKYFPTEAQATKNLPAVDGVIADLTKMGWPKDKKGVK